MKIVEYFKENLFIGAGATLLVVSLARNGPQTTIMLKCSQAMDESIVSISFSADGEKIYAAFSNKLVCCWDLSTSAVVGSKFLKKRPTAMAYSTYQSAQTGASRECVLVSDKAGDIYALDANLSRSILVGGHTASVVTDMALHGDLVATADRDEKVRISRVPNVETIQAYCMGHENVVCSVAFVEMKSGVLNLVSIGWDHQLCLWEPRSGARLASHFFESAGASKISAAADETAAPVDTEQEKDEPEEKQYIESEAGHFPFKVYAINSLCVPLVGVIFKGLKKLQLLTVEQSSDKAYTNQFEEVISFELPDIPVDLVVTEKAQLVVVLPAPHYVLLYQLETSSEGGSTKFTYKEVSASFSAAASLEECRKTCSALNVSFSQQLASSAAGDGEEEMKKHILDAPFAKEIHFKGGKRSGYVFKKGEKRAMIEKEKAAREGVAKKAAKVDS